LHPRELPNPAAAFAAFTRCCRFPDVHWNLQAQIPEEAVPDDRARRIYLYSKRRASLVDMYRLQPGETDHEPGDSAADVAAAIRGEADALRAVWQANRRWIAAVILAHKPREADLEDLLQEVAMSYVRMVGKLRDEATLKPWLRTIAINAARASGRDASRRRRGAAWVRGTQLAGSGAEAALNWNSGGGSAGAAAGITSTVNPGGERSDDRAGRSEEARRLMDLASRLPDGYREPLLLKAIRGMSYREIGRVLDLPETTVETRIARGRRMLRDLAEGKTRISAGGVA
jgi:RNA polymerase sigma-70 factor, ECF subfamily